MCFFRAEVYGSKFSTVKIKTDPNSSKTGESPTFNRAKITTFTVIQGATILFTGEVNFCDHSAQVPY